MIKDLLMKERPIIEIHTEDEMHELLSQNKNTVIEQYDYKDGMILLYQGIQKYFMVCFPDDTYLMKAYSGHPLYDEINRKPDFVVKGKAQCYNFENMLRSFVLNF